VVAGMAGLELAESAGLLPVLGPTNLAVDHCYPTALVAVCDRDHARQGSLSPIQGVRGPLVNSPRPLAGWPRETGEGVY
jgi:hypothetical protein